MRKTKIIATIGPASDKEAILTKMVLSGMNVARLNFSHGTYKDHKEKIDMVNKINKHLGTDVSIMLDTKGPEIRTHFFEKGQVYIKKNSEIRIHMNEILGNETAFSVNYPNLINDIQIGSTILIDDGYLQTIVIDIDKERDIIVVNAKNSHLLTNRRGINIPNTTLNLPFVSSQDYDDILFAIKNNVKYIAASFTRKKEDILEIKEILKQNNNDIIKVIAKIENQEGVDNILEILNVADGIMIARGDLGVEIYPEDIPRIQKDLILKAQQLGKIVIVATQMLESMQKNPRPTRAEVSDVANAIYEGTDVVMLSGETASGMYPLESLELMDRIITRTEKYVNYKQLIDNIEVDPNNLVMDLNAYGVAKMTIRTDIKAIITNSHLLAKQISKYRVNCPIYLVGVEHENLNFSLDYGIYETKMSINNIEYNELGIYPKDLVIIINDSNFSIKKI